MDIRKEILDADDRTREEVDVSEYWPTVGKVWVSVMECGDRDSWECLVADAITGGKHIRALLLVRCITDENGKRIFTDDDVSAFSSKNWKALDLCYDVAIRLNKLSDDDLEAIAKKSEGAGGESS